MSERYKIFDADKAYFITFTLVELVNLFDKSNYSKIIIDSIKFCQKEKGLELFGYCIMPSHVHLIVRSEKTYLSNIVRDIKKFTAGEILKALKKDQSNSGILKIFSKAAQSIKRNKNFKVWQDGYHPEIITSNKFFYQKMNYMHNNPLEAGLANNVIDYPLSSARNYSGSEAVLEIIIESQQQITY